MVSRRFLHLVLRSILVALILSTIGIAYREIYLDDLFLSPVRTAVFAVPLLIVGVGSTILLFARSSVQLLALIYAIAIGVGVYAAEVYLDVSRGSAAEAAWTPWKPTAEIPLPVVCGKYVMIVEDNGQVRSAVEIDGSEIQPVSGIAGIPIGGGHSSDRYGFRNPPGEWQGDTRVLVVGDSFAFGVDAAPGKSFVDLIRNDIGPVINLGCPWNGPLLELAALAEYGPVARPDTVLWFFYEGNDLLDLEVERRSPLLTRYLESGFAQGLPDKQPLLDKLLTNFAETRIERRSRTGSGDPRSLAYVVYGDPSQRALSVNWDRVLVLQNLRWSQGVIDFGSERSTFPLLREILQRAVETTHEWGGDFLFVYLPSESRFLGKLARIEADAYRERVLAGAESLGVPVIDLTPRFANDPQPRSLFAGHYSEAGNALVAEVALHAIRAGDSALNRR